jgi:hypothetical protein
MYLIQNTQELISERRRTIRMPCFCQVFDRDFQFIGVSFDLTLDGVRLSLHKAIKIAETLPVTLRRADSHQLLQVSVVLEPIWYQQYNARFNEVGGRFIDGHQTQQFQEFYAYCQKCGPSGLVCPS